MQDWWTKLTYGESEEEARSDATWESVVNETVPEDLSQRMKSCKDPLQRSVTTAVGLELRFGPK